MAYNLLENKILGLIRTLGTVTVTELAHYTNHPELTVKVIVEKNIHNGKLKWGEEKES
jgi:hypothetical protein